jgi:hypothetical protein
MTMEQQVAEAVARGWCHEKNADKVMDVDLADAIIAEVVKSFTPTQHPHGDR